MALVNVMVMFKTSSRVLHGILGKRQPVLGSFICARGGFFPLRLPCSVITKELSDKLSKCKYSFTGDFII